MAASDRARKVEKIFKQFDGNGDGRLNRGEMAALVIAVNPRVKFSDEQIRAILDEVFRTYGDFIDGDRGLSLEGLLRTYDDGAGDVDRDFDALGLHLDGDEEDEGSTTTEEAAGTATAAAAAAAAAAKTAPVSIMDERADAQRRRNVGAWASSPSNGIVYESTWGIIEDLEIILRRTEAKLEARRKLQKGAKKSDLAEAELKEVGQLRSRADTSRTQDEAFDAHMAMGRSLSEHGFFDQALVSFKRAIELRPTDARPHFRAGNTLYSLQRYSEAREAYEAALEAAPSGGGSAGLVAQVHVNLGIVLECEGMLLNACEHYREAAILQPSHHRALKLLGSALLGVGEYRAAEKALGEAVFLSPGYADAHCDLGSALHVLGDDERAGVELQRAIDNEPEHLEALYNLAGLLRDRGDFQAAAGVYARVLTLQPGNWKAQLNRAAALLGSGNIEEARRSLKAAFKMSSRVEIYDALGHIKVLLKSGGDPCGSSVVVEASKFEVAMGTSTTPRPWLVAALAVRSLQLTARLHRCSISNLRSAIVEDKRLPPLSQAAGSVSEKVMRKSDVEQWLRRLFASAIGGCSAEVFAASIKAINEKLLTALDRGGSGRIDFGMLLACMAPLCSGQVEKRKRMAFDSLVWRSSRGLGAEIVRSDAKAYFRHLRTIYMPQQQQGDVLWEVRGGEEEQASMSFPEFLDMFDDPDWGFGILSTLVKLESYDRVRHNGLACASCCYPVVGLRFKELQRGFDLCSLCYSEGKVPAGFVSTSAKQQADLEDMFTFKELKRPDAVTDKLRFKRGQQHKQQQQQQQLQ